MIRIDNNVSWGNVISWLVILVGFTIGYGKVTSGTDHNTKEIQTIKDADEARSKELRDIAIKLAEHGIILKQVDKKIDEVIADQRRIKQ